MNKFLDNIKRKILLPYDRLRDIIDSIKRPFLRYSKSKKLEKYGLDLKSEKIKKKIKYLVKCAVCKRRLFTMAPHTFRCTYCKKYFCEKHRLPEKHKCKGKLKAPPGGMREIHTKRGIKVFGK